MKDALIREYVGRMTKNDVNSFAVKNNVFLNDTELNLVYTQIKENWQTIVYGDYNKILNIVKDDINDDSLKKIDQLYHYYKNRYL